MNKQQATHDYFLRKRKTVSYVPGSITRAYDQLSCVVEPEDEAPETPNELKYRKFLTDNFVVLAVTALSFTTRFIHLSSSDIVVWDEAHFGKFANSYINRKFYFDVHPPLGKMIIALGARLFGYDGSFDFGSGKVYPETVPIYEMRAVNAAFGSFIPLFMYGICKNLGIRKEYAVLVASMMIFDNAIVTISRFVLLDSILLFFTSASIFLCTHKPLVDKSPRWMLATGICLGMTASIKWVGLFTYAFAGIMSISHIWSLLPTLHVDNNAFVFHLVKRSIFLIVVPFSVYMTFFGVHFLILENSGSGDAHMSSIFQSNLNNGPLPNVNFQVRFGDKITLRNRGPFGGLLHSHKHAYPEGSKQTQVTLYSHRDSNNWWTILPAWSEKLDSDMFVQSGSIVRLLHNNTIRNLHTHNIPAALDVYNNEVSGYGNSTRGDSKDHWIVEIENPKFNEKLTSLRGVFSLKNVVEGCYLSTSGQKLPKWGFGQIEVSCVVDKSSRSLWNVEQVHCGEDDCDECDECDSEIDADFFDFVDDFVNLNKVMMISNNGLVLKEGKRDLLVSKPSQWIFLDVGLRMCNWRNETVKFYLLGNPIVWWTSSVSMLFFFVDAFCMIVYRKMQSTRFTTEQASYLSNGMLISAGWLLHYIPFFLMGRVTYLHHYFPALMISTIQTGIILTRWVPSQLSKKVMVGLVSLITTSFVFFAPMSYGFVGDATVNIPFRKWRRGWTMY